MGRTFILRSSIAALLILLLAACTFQSGSTQGVTAVHMSDSDFTQHTVTLNKGDMLVLINDAPVIHIIANGSWVNNIPQPAQENGLPEVHVTIAGNDSATLGPFNTAGTFHLYCTVHPAMNLLVIVI